jgi:long-chain acyl-CoA synthetase
MLTLTSVLQRTVNLYGNRTAIIESAHNLTWKEFGDRIARGAGLLRSLGIDRGSRYGILCRNSIENAELMHAGYWMGAIPVPVNFRLAPPEIAYILRDSECRLFVVEAEFAELLKSPELRSWEGQLLCVGTHEAPNHWPRYELLREQAAPEPLWDAAEEDDALLLYTGGTTGRPKGVRLTHLNVVSNAMQIAFECEARSGDVYLHAAPMFHSAELLGTPYTIAGAAHAFLPKFSGPLVLDAIQKSRVTSTMLTPTMIIAVLQEPNFADYDLSCLRRIIYGSSPMAAEWIAKAVHAFEKTALVQTYGLTETSPILTILPMADHLAAIDTGNYELLRSAGRPIVGVDMKVVDADGKEAPPGSPGEVIVRGPNVTRGYFKVPEENGEAFRGGWFHTGDIGRMDENGYLYLLDRAKDMIITGGENVYSLEVEAVLYQHPAVHECAVFGISDEKFGQALVAAIVPVSGKIPTEAELIAHCRGKIGGYKIPRRYLFLQELPKSAMNKVMKNELRRRYEQNA